MTAEGGVLTRSIAIACWDFHRAKSIKFLGVAQLSNEKLLFRLKLVEFQQSISIRRDRKITYVKCSW